MCIKIKSIIFFAVVLLLFLSITPVQADILYDHFDGTSLDSAWSITTVNVSGSSYNISDSKLTVTSIQPTDVNNWAYVKFSQSFNDLSGTMSFDFDFSWDSGNSSNAIVRAFLYLYDNNNVVTQVGYVDGWLASYGTMYAKAGNSIYYDPTKPLPSSGTASVDILLTNGNIDILWDDDKLISGTLNSSIDKAVLEFSYKNYTNSYLGTVSVDLVADPQPTSSVPEPATMLLLGFGLLGLTGLKRRIGKN